VSPGRHYRTVRHLTVGASGSWTFGLNIFHRKAFAPAGSLPDRRRCQNCAKSPQLDCRGFLCLWLPRLHPWGRFFKVKDQKTAIVLQCPWRERTAARLYAADFGVLRPIRFRGQRGRMPAARSNKRHPESPCDQRFDQWPAAHRKNDLLRPYRSSVRHLHRLAAKFLQASFTGCFVVRPKMRIKIMEVPATGTSRSEITGRSVRARAHVPRDSSVLPGRRLMLIEWCLRGHGDGVFRLVGRISASWIAPTYGRSGA